MKQYLLSYLILFTILLCGCSKSSDNILNCAERWESVTVAATSYVEDPTVDNCNAYLNALRSYIKSDDCVGDIWFDAQRQALDDLEASSCE